MEKCQGNMWQETSANAMLTGNQTDLHSNTHRVVPMPLDCLATSNVATASDNGWNGHSNAIILATIQRISYKFSVGKP